MVFIVIHFDPLEEEHKTGQFETEKEALDYMELLDHFGMTNIALFVE